MSFSVKTSDGHFSQRLLIKIWYQRNWQLEIYFNFKLMIVLFGLRVINIIPSAICDMVVPRSKTAAFTLFFSADKIVTERESERESIRHKNHF